jgi:hypothetical protein
MFRQCCNSGLAQGLAGCASRVSDNRHLGPACNMLPGNALGLRFNLRLIQ